MTKLQEMVEEEAARAEAESPDDDEPGEPEPEPEPEPTPEEEAEREEPPSMEKALEAFEEENERHAMLLREVMGDDFEAFRPCLVCNGVGYEPGPQLTQDPDLVTCAACSGEGQHTTGSRRQGYELRDCTVCMGQGFTVMVQTPELPAVPVAPVPRFDPYTGELLGELPVAENGQALAPWAPGYVPPAVAPPRTATAP